MLRIIVCDDHGSVRFGVEGSLTKPWAEELRKSWQEVSASTAHPDSLLVELTAMTNIDSIGKEILMEMYQSGVKLVGSGIMTRAVIEEITRAG
jgi:hypothetical protein